ncbi:ATP-binding cassette domain-containing protein [Candidatus Pseudothioglobus singularis]|nr:ATP-binding cassette domain-containing protein [Candidatus Pseudothioglobus singularis]MDA7440910.1 ATP-binding cassette domain-containing protein [Candidatus Pseudothioglobus singularis]MDA8692032.1 ATP-binding cassette domain-containing protein [Candidatus Pseudothioglobus singularis]MDA8755409.1 ATP-binding cassette domain-containing protein [Candidatus Pseudothioglobus singularis]MDA8854878.1 ATP-binding cassette domain-containing protein [Candidatus Pseudothioglobus singularis]MDB45985|tara:strand:- start:1520 stop:2275 length:756 start_codon:yes stop_codon:yes gene_type:complete
MTKNKSEPIVKVKNISKSFGGVRALRDGSFNLNSGEIISIVGANGAGKSTLMKLVSGSLVPDSGSIEINGVEVPRSSHSVSHMREKGVEVVYQDLALVPNMTAPYNLFLGRIPRKWRFFVDEKKMRDKTREILSQLNVTTIQDLSVPISSMSGGQQQIIAIGRAIAWGKEVVILDEPTAALGPNETEKVERVVNEVNSKFGTSFILVSHNIEQVKRLSSRIIVTHHGKTSSEFNTEEISAKKLVEAITLGK